MTRRLMTSDGFRAAMQKGEEIDDVHLVMEMDTELKMADDVDRAVNFVLSTGAVDRHGDTVNAEGWDLRNYRKNPVALWGHDYSALPLGKGKNVRVEDGMLKGTIQFTPPGTARFNDVVYDMLKGGFLSAVSVGFAPRKWVWAEDSERRFGIDYTEQELLEFSVVSVPANPEALIEARGLGIDIAPLLDNARKMLGMTEDMATITKSRLDELLAAEKELRELKTRDLVLPSPKKHSRLTERSLRLARLARS